MRQSFGNENYSESVSIVPPVINVYNNVIGSNKLYQIPTNEMWRVNFAYALMTSTATAGNRLLTFRAYDASGNIILDLFSPVVQAASLVRRYAFVPGATREAAFAADELVIGIPKNFYFLPGSYINVLDTAVVDLASDSLVFSMQYEKYKV